MVKLFHSNRPLVLVFLPVIIGVYVSLNWYFNYHHFETVNFGLWGEVKADVELPSRLLAPLMIFGNALLLNLIFNRNEFMERNSYLVSLIYVVFMSFFHSFYFVDGQSIAQLFFILSVQQIFRLNQHDDARKRVFNLAFLAGMATTFDPVFLLSFPFLFWIIWIFRPFLFRESILTILGFMLPLIYARVYRLFFIQGLDVKEISSTSLEMHLVDLLTVAILVLILVFLSLKSVFRKMQQGSIRLRKLFSVINMMAIFISGLLAIEYFFFNKVQSVSLYLIVLMFIIPYAFGVKEPRSSASFFFYLCFFYSVGKFFIPFIQ